MTALGRSFWQLYASSATSNLSHGIGRTVLPLLAASITRDPLLIAGLTSFAFLPWLLFALPAGALTDRVDRSHAMAVANAVRATATGVLAALCLLGGTSVPVLYGGAFVLGTAETLYDSATRALLPQVIRTGNLERANSLLTVEETLGQTFLGAPLGSALFALAAALPFGLTAVGFTAAAIAVLSLPGSYRAAREEGTTIIRGEIAAGVRWLAGHRLLRGLTLVSAATSFLQSMINGQLVLYVLEVLRLEPSAFGLILLVGGSGALVGGLVTPRLSARVGRSVLLPLGAAVSATATLLLGTVANGVVAAGLFAVAAAGVMVWNVLTMSLRQALVPAGLFGRVQGAYRTVVWGAIPLGALAGGILARATSVSTVFVVAGAGLLVAAATLAVLVRRHLPAEVPRLAD